MIFEPGVDTWVEFLIEFQKLYFPLALRQAKKNELLNLKQVNMMVNEYQHKLFELLSYCPYISASLEAKYENFLQGLNLEIHDRVSICDDPTSYEGLVNRFRQTKKSLQHNRSFSSFHPSNSPSLSRSLVNLLLHRVLVMVFSISRRRKVSVSIVDDDTHPTNVVGRQRLVVVVRPSRQSVESTNQKTRIPGQVIPPSQDRVQRENEDVIADVVLFVSTPVGHSALAKCVFLGCSLKFEGFELSENLMILAMKDFDYILGIDILTSYRATVDCYQNIVQFRLVKGDSWFFYGKGAQPPMPLVSARRACRDLEAGGQSYLIYVIEMCSLSRAIEELPVVYEYRNFFPHEIPGFPPVREVEFGIELVPGTAPIYRTPYYLAPSEMRDFQ
ncbi:uncharacterized protein [Henckelia pumila]|uniref:uncharacterized protein n=1 Tax=Henckelia pumila TaxID=405737 RepID=UPI003C6E5D15